MYVTIVTLTTRDYLKAHTRALITQGAEVHIAASPSPALFEELSRSGAVLHPVHIPREIDLRQDAMAHWTAFYRDVLKHRLKRYPRRPRWRLAALLAVVSVGLLAWARRER